MWTTLTARRIGLVMGGALAAVVCVAGVQAQELKTQAPAAAAQPGNTPPLPEDTLRAYNRVEPWVRAWTSPKLEDAKSRNDAKGKPLAGAFGACVNLRWHGELIGRGVGAAFWPAAGQTPEDADNLRRLTCARAVGDAMRQADAKLPLPNDLSRADAAKQLTPDILISLELAGPLKPLTAATWDELDASLNPGLDGLAVTTQMPGGEEPGLQGGTTRIKFPSEMMMGNLTPQKTLRSMIAGAIGEGGAAAALESPKDLREKHGVRMWTFRVSHVAQGVRGGGAVFLYRGSKLVATGEMTVGELRGMAERLAKNLVVRVQAGNGQIPDYHRYQPWEARFEGDSDHTDAAVLLSWIALSSYTSFASPEETTHAVEGFLENASQANVTPSSTDDWLLFSLTSSGFADRSKEKSYDLRRAKIGGAIQQVVDIADAHALPDQVDVPKSLQSLVQQLNFQELSPTGRSLLLYCFAHRYLASDGGRLDKVARLLGRTIAECPREQVVSMMPWFGWAELAVDAHRRSLAGPPANTDIPSAIALREMRAQCWKHQLGFADINDDSLDMLGGICFTKSAGTALPTWQCVRPIAFLATMLGDDRLTEPAERKLETFRLLLALRFLRQLQADESCGWMYPEPEKAIGGIRAAAWDQSMPPDATSLTLMAVCEAIKSLEKLDAAEKTEKR